MATFSIINNDRSSNAYMEATATATAISHETQIMDSVPSPAHTIAPISSPTAVAKPTTGIFDTVTSDKKLYNKSAKGYSISMAYFSIKNMTNLKVQDKINKVVMDDTLDSENYMQQNVSLSTYPVELTCDGEYYVISQDRNFLSVGYHYDGYMGAASVTNVYGAWVFDLTTGEKVQLSALFSENYDYENYLTRAMILMPKYAEIKCQYAEANDTFIYDSTEFYFKDKALCILAYAWEYPYYNVEFFFPLAQFGSNFVLWDVTVSTAGPIKYANVKLDSFLNIRKSPDATADVLGYFLRWDAVQVLGQEGEWYHILTANNISGYVKTQFLSDSSSLE